MKGCCLCCRPAGGGNAEVLEEEEEEFLLPDLLPSVSWTDRGSPAGQTRGCLDRPRLKLVFFFFFPLQRVAHNSPKRKERQAEIFVFLHRREEEEEGEFKV